MESALLSPGTYVSYIYLNLYVLIISIRIIFNSNHLFQNPSLSDSSKTLFKVNFPVSLTLHLHQCSFYTTNLNFLHKKSGTTYHFLSIELRFKLKKTCSVIPKSVIMFSILVRVFVYVYVYLFLYKFT